MADPPTKLSYASAASGVSSVSDDTSGSASGRRSSDESRPNRDEERCEQQESSSHDDFQRSAAYFEAYTKYQEFIIFIASHFQHSSRCRSLIVTAPAAALRKFAGLIQLSYRQREIYACFTYLNILICTFFTLLVYCVN